MRRPNCHAELFPAPAPSIPRGCRRNSCDGRLTRLSTDPPYSVPDTNGGAAVVPPPPMANRNVVDAASSHNSTRVLIVPPWPNTYPGFAPPPPALAPKGKTGASKKAPKVTASCRVARTTSTPLSKTPKKMNNKMAESDVFSMCLSHICVELVLCI